MNPVIRSVIHHPQNPLDYISYMFVESYKSTNNFQQTRYTFSPSIIRCEVLFTKLNNDFSCKRIQVANLFKEIILNKLSLHNVCY
jgi:hypothetical protein